MLLALARLSIRERVVDVCVGGSDAAGGLQLSALPGLVRVEPVGKRSPGEALEEAYVVDEARDELGALFQGHAMARVLLSLQLSGKHPGDAGPPRWGQLMLDRGAGAQHPRGDPVAHRVAGVGGDVLRRHVGEHAGVDGEVSADPVQRCPG